MAKTATYSLIQSQTLGSAAASVTFSSIPATYTDLVLIIEGALTASAIAAITAQFNGDTASNYSVTNVSGNGTTASSTRFSTQPSLYAGLLSTTRSNTIFNIIDYSNATTYKSTLSRANVSSSTVRATAGLWRSTAAITSMVIGNDSSDTFIAGSTFKLYGIEAYK
jgi:hypothetical protein